MTIPRTALAPLLLLVAAVGANTASAQYSGSMNGPLGGEYLLGLELAYTHRNQDAVESESLLIQSDFSRFFGRANQVGIEFSSRFDSLAAGGHTGGFFLGPLYNYNWYPAERTGLYAGARLGAAFEDVSGASDHTDLAWGFQVGLRQWLTPRTALTLEPRWTRIEIESNGQSERDQFDLLLGINLVL